MSPLTARVVRLFVALLLMVPVTALAQSATTSITGTVTDSVTKAPLAGALVTLEGTALSAATDRTGTFRITGAPVGTHALLITYLGHPNERTPVTLRASETLTVDVALSQTAFSETVQVTAKSIDNGQAQALNQQKTAPNIINVVSADPNAAEAASRIPGVSIARDQGEGRYILIRGTEARLNSVMIDGERIPSPEDTRQIMLDMKTCAGIVAPAKRRSAATSISTPTISRRFGLKRSAATPAGYALPA
jgi:hypothetical protein